MKAEHTDEEKFNTYKSYYESFANILIQTNIFKSKNFSNDGFALLFDMMNDFDPDSNIVINPMAGLLLPWIIPSLPEELLLQSSETFIDYCKKHANSLREFTKVGMVSLCIQLCYDKLNLIHSREEGVDQESMLSFIDSNCNLSSTPHLNRGASGADSVVKTLSSIAKYLLASYLTMPDLLCYLHFIVRQDVQLQPLQNSQLMPPWLMNHDGIASRNWENISFLENLCYSLEASSSDVPHVILGSHPVLNKNQPSYLKIPCSNYSLFYPYLCFSFSAWIKLPKSEDEEENEGLSNDEKPQLKHTINVIPLFSIKGPTSFGHDCFFEVHVDLDFMFVRIAIKNHNNLITTLRFKPLLFMPLSSWNLITISVKKPKRFGSSKSMIQVFVNGILSQALNTDTFEVESITQGNISCTAGITMTEVYVGRYLITKSDLAADSADVDEFMWSNLSCPKSWHVGPFHIFDEALTQPQVTLIFIKGPAYTGWFRNCYLIISFTT
jgi:hypothetical protein